MFFLLMHIQHSCLESHLYILLLTYRLLIIFFYFLVFYFSWKMLAYLISGCNLVIFVSIFAFLLIFVYTCLLGLILQLKKKIRKLGIKGFIWKNMNTTNLRLILRKNPSDMLINHDTIIYVQLSIQIVHRYKSKFEVLALAATYGTCYLYTCHLRCNNIWTENSQL